MDAPRRGARDRRGPPLRRRDRAVALPPDDGDDRGAPRLGRRALGRGRRARPPGARRSRLPARASIGSLDVVGLVALGRGRLDEARAGSRIRSQSGRTIGEVQFILHAAVGPGRDRPRWPAMPTRAVARSEEAPGDRPSTRASGRSSIPFVVTGVRACLAARRPDDAERWLAPGPRAPRRLGRIAEPALANADGLIRLADGLARAARDAARAAVPRLGGARPDLGGGLGAPRPRPVPPPLEPLRRGGLGPRRRPGHGRRARAASRSSPRVEELDPDRARAGLDRGAVAAADRPRVRGRQADRRGADERRDRRASRRSRRRPRARTSSTSWPSSVTRRAEIAAWATAIGRVEAPAAAASASPAGALRATAEPARAPGDPPRVVAVRR